MTVEAMHPRQMGMRVLQNNSMHENQSQGAVRQKKRGQTDPRLHRLHQGHTDINVALDGNKTR
jgi:hypothetical protein